MMMTSFPLGFYITRESNLITPVTHSYYWYNFKTTLTVREVECAGAKDEG